MPARRGSFARTPAEERFHLRQMLIARIVADPGFGQALSSLLETYAPHVPELSHWQVLADEVRFGPDRPTLDRPSAPVPDVAAYVEAVRPIARRFGLDRLSDNRGRELGATLIHDWCRACRRAGRELPATRLLGGLMHTEYVAEIGEVVARSEHDFGDVRVVDELVWPVVRIDIVDEWDPWREPRAAARKRLLRLASHKIQEALDRLTGDAIAKGYRFPDTSPALERDLGRLAQLMTGRATLDELIERAPGTRDPESAVTKSIERIAERAGVSTDGWRLGRR